MRWLDRYLDKYLAKKVIYLVRTHFSQYDIRVDFSPELKVYDLELVLFNSVCPLMSFSENESLLVLRKLLASGWESLDTKVKKGLLCKDQ